jgi:MFS family permease
VTSGHISERIGRKPVLTMGIMVTAVSIASFGLATSLPATMVTLGGLLDGNVGVLQTSVAELVTCQRKRQRRAYSITLLSGVLARSSDYVSDGRSALATPCESYYLSLFPRDTI